MNFDEIREYWDNRAKKKLGAQSTTQDVYLREIEYHVLLDKINEYSPSPVADVGCGDGRTTIRLAQQFPCLLFQGFDYSPEMINIAKNNAESEDIPNIKFGQCDICEGLDNKFCAIYTTRCLINLPSYDLQKLAMENICESLTEGGFYFMIENFIEGHDNFNNVRKRFGLPEIPVREHNLFFSRDRLHSLADGKFNILDEINISSSYYLMSRIVYSKICDESNKQPDYFDDHHRYASMLPFSGEFGPVRLVCMQKIMSKHP